MMIQWRHRHTRMSHVLEKYTIRIISLDKKLLSSLSIKIHYWATALVCSGYRYLESCNKSSEYFSMRHKRENIGKIQVFHLSEAFALIQPLREWIGGNKSYIQIFHADKYSMNIFVYYILENDLAINLFDYIILIFFLYLIHAKAA